MKRYTLWMGLILALAVGAAGCGGRTAKETPRPEQTELLVAAAASMTDALRELGAMYEKENPDVKLSFSFGASGALQRQIEQGAPADVFFSAAQKQMDALEQGGRLLDGTRRDLLVNRVVLIAPAGNRADLREFADLAGERVQRIALGEPKGVPVGQYAAEVFASLGILAQVQAKAVYGSDVRQVLTWVESGEVDCGVVYATDAAISPRVVVVSDAPAGSCPPVVYPAAVVKASKNAAAAQAFLAFASRPESAKVFAQYGFQVK